MTHSKQRTEQHLIDEAGQRLLRGALPPSWVLRDYRPDYGLDYSLEVFRKTGLEGSAPKFETLGEHVFIQLKSCSETKRGMLPLFMRYNVEKATEQLDRNKLVGEIETIRFSLETPELVRVHRMGAALPVLLLVADIAAQSCYFVCLNDYADKILVPRHGDYTGKASRTIHIPALNLVSGPETGHTALRWYAKRAKLYAAFQKFVYQNVEIGYAFEGPEFPALARHFAQILLSLTFGMIRRCGRSFRTTARRYGIFSIRGCPASASVTKKLSMNLPKARNGLTECAPGSGSRKSPSFGGVSPSCREITKNSVESGFCPRRSDTNPHTREDGMRDCVLPNSTRHGGHLAAKSGEKVVCVEV